MKDWLQLLAVVAGAGCLLGLIGFGVWYDSNLKRQNFERGCAIVGLDEQQCEFLRALPR